MPWQEDASQKVMGSNVTKGIFLVKYLLKCTFYPLAVEPTVFQVNDRNTPSKTAYSRLIEIDQGLNFLKVNSNVFQPCSVHLQIRK